MDPVSAGSKDFGQLIGNAEEQILQYPSQTNIRVSHHSASLLQNMRCISTPPP